MKIKLLIGAVIAAAIGSNAFALQITKGKLISHKEWKTGDVTASYQTGTKTPQSIKSAYAKLNIGPSIPVFLVSETSTATGHVGERISVNNNAYVWVRNDSADSTRNYYHLSSICVEKSDSITECVYSNDQVQLEPGGEFYDATTPVLTVKFDQPGVYHTDAFSFVMGANRHMTSNSSATITVA